MIENIPRRPVVRGDIMGPTNPVAGAGRFALHRDPHPARVATFAEDVGRGLSMRPYTLMPKYFYDDLGSALFEPIELVELGSGSATKTRLIIDAILERQDTLTFHPIDISPDALIESSQALV